MLSSLAAQQAKDLALPVLWHGFDSWPQNLIPRPKKKKKKLYVGALPFILAVLGGRTFKEVIKVK